MRKTLNDRTRSIFGLEAACFIHWVETRKKATPAQDDIDRWIQGALDREGFAYTPDDIQMIAILGLCTSREAVEKCLSMTGGLAEFDRAMAAAGAYSSAEALGGPPRL
jgi:hypothetical protein